MTEKPLSLSWEISFPLLTNSNIVKAWLKAMAVTYLMCMLILAPVFIGTDQADGLPVIAFWFAGIILGITGFGFLIMLVIFGNRSRAKFTVTEQGIFYECLDKKAKTLSRMAVAAGILAGSAGTAGAGLLSISNEKISMKWSGAFKAVFDERNHTIRLRNQYRDILQVYCTSENYEKVKEIVETNISRGGTSERLSKSSSPLPRAIFSTVLVLLACLPLYALNDLTHLDIMVPLLIMTFSLAMVWMIPLFAWVVLPLEGYIIIHTVIVLSRFREFKLINTYTYRNYEVLNSGDWIIILSGLLGMAYLGWISVKSLKGKFVPVLMRDYEGMQ
ncbi:MAG: hypothetical protein KKF30_00595 [Proteobacteria bacterium]|nr:hypothetical protein [Desulfobacteraceae bacterium]MBU4001722.1 hypothetical protein [Pseudomonadota bacterium]MBU4055384.1 hypothetical protein [Pseudomonadota bacterium]MBU4315750.1 hypothetical protein [Pseudomonadota bacterium]MBU4471608.1 hypothetical protein [Pseudomonadota bacterium]